jgi:hypothetical protein
VAEQGITIMRLEGGGGAATAATTPTKSPSGAAQTPNPELLARIHELERARDDLQLELERVTVRLKAKAQRADELTSEVARLRDDVDARTMDLDTLRVRDLRGDTVSREAILQVSCGPLKSEIGPVCPWLILAPLVACCTRVPAGEGHRQPPRAPGPARAKGLRDVGHPGRTRERRHGRA